MANFGLSIGDILLVSKLACTMYKSSKRAGDDFRAIRADGTTRSLNQRSSQRQKLELSVLLVVCKHDLQDLDKLLAKYRSLKTRNPRAYAKLSFTVSR
ncbi:hypothetical protein K458DRAFT_310631 [Lentithecium fluviatile CBS 122367]|uniref:Uncharacterized protein n=1 Tax=Lentithecium fluviatile CBS 122367 TaxID=1168545 RepID=A0A6G1IRW3_9PLEO|nr:hypothetical protein K458DRAFT_310631 [Lentithecium fluviatile CBS 122367]